MTRVGVIGSGNVGTTLAAGFLKEGYEVTLGTRDVNKEEVVKFAAANPGALVGTFEQTAKFGEIIVLATGGGVTLDAVKLAGVENFSGKIVIDATNPISGAPVNGVFPYFTTDKSLLELVQELVPDAKVVKAFCSTGAYTFYKPSFEGGRGTLFIAGNDDGAKAVVTDIIDKFGWNAEDAGPAIAGKAVEALCIIWCHRGFTKNEWTHGFKVVHKA